MSPPHFTYASPDVAPASPRAGENLNIIKLVAYLRSISVPFHKSPSKTLLKSTTIDKFLSTCSTIHENFSPSSKCMKRVLESRLPKAIRYKNGAAAMKRDALKHQKIKLEDFCVLKQIGYGNFGVVYVARDERLNKKNLVALKVDLNKNYVLWEAEIHNMVRLIIFYGGKANSVHRS